MKLTYRQKEILKDILEGLSNKEIREKRFIEQATIKSHLAAIYKAYDVHSRAELIVKIYRGKMKDLKV